MTASPACDWHHPHLPCPAFAWVEHGRADQPCRVSALWPPRSQSPGGVCLPEVLAAEIAILREASTVDVLRVEARGDRDASQHLPDRGGAIRGLDHAGRHRRKPGANLGAVHGAKGEKDEAMALWRNAWQSSTL